MAAGHFDALARVLTTSPARRGLLRASLGFGLAGALGAFGRGAAGAKACGPCRLRKRDRCTKHRPDDTPCHGEGRCWAGICHPRPTCRGAGSEFTTAQCRGTTCNVTKGFCLTGSTFAPCFAGADCQSNACIGYRCP